MDTVLVILRLLLSVFKTWRTDTQSLSSLLLREGLSELMILKSFFQIIPFLQKFKKHLYLLN